VSREIPGHASRDPQRLCPCVREKFHALQDAAIERGILTRTVETLRDDARQAHYISIGTSWTTRSLHLPQPPNGLALAFDVVPTDYVLMKSWNPAGPFWRELGQIGKALGLLWGGDWQSTPDRPHFELKKCQCAAPPPKAEESIA
jgi:hypothetical protein